MNPNETIVLVREQPRGPSQLVEVPVPAQVISRVKFPEQQQLQSDTEQVVIIKAIRLITPSVLTNAPILGGVNAPLTELQKISLILYCEGWEKGQLIPLLTLNDTFTEGSGEPWNQKTEKFADWKNVDWTKSYLQYSNGTPSNGTAYTVCLEVEYARFDAKGREIVGPY